MDSRSKELKSVFAAYLNMARQNVYVTMLHISKLMGIEEDSNKEDKLWEMKVLTSLNGRANSKPEKLQKTIKLLHKHFPFLTPMIDYTLSEKSKSATPDTYYQILKTLFKLLNLLRNDYTHYHLVDEALTSEQTQQDSKRIAKLLRNSFDGARRVVKTRFGYTDEDMLFLTGEKRYQKEIVPGEYITGYDRKSKMKVTLPKMKHIEKDNYQYKLSKNNGELSDIGLLFLICLLLHKKYGMMFIDKVKIFTDNNSQKEKKIIREILTLYRIRLPKERMESTRPQIALGLDMLNELQKCPDELFQTFCPKDQDRFRFTDKFGEQVLLKRSHDRFPYLAMRYIDDNKIFTSVRFQVSLGNYRYKFYNKQGIDSNHEDRVRSLQKELNGFGRLTEIEEKRKDKEWHQGLLRPFEEVQIDTVETKPYITDHRANYVFNGNRIGLLLNRDMYMPSIQGDKAPCLPPTCWMSIYELPALVFHHLLCDKEHKGNTEKIIKDCVANYQRFFKDIQNGVLKPIEEEKYESVIAKYGITPSDVPGKLQDYLKNRKIDNNERFNRLSKAKLEKMIQSTTYRLEKFEKEYAMLGIKDNKIGKKGYIDVRPGRLAQYLVKDFMFFQPVNKESLENGKGTGKVTGLNYQILQSTLATAYNISTLKSLFVKAQLLESKNKHPFLSWVLEKEPKNIFCFYYCYLEEKIICLKSLLALASKENDYNYSFLHPKRIKWAVRSEEYYQKLAGRYLEAPIELPRGLFEKAIKELLQKKFNDNPAIQAALNNPKGCNVSFLIHEYFKNIHSEDPDENQDFYSPKEGHYLRNYKYFDILYASKVKNKMENVYFTIDEMEKKSKDETIVNEYLHNFQKDKKQENKGCLIQKNKDKEECKEVSRYKESSDQKNKEDQEKERRRLKKYLNEYRENEKCIRRYKVQDMLLFLMAKDILLNEWKDAEIKEYRLKNICSKQEKSILSQEIPFSITLNWEKGEKQISKVITQEKLKLKNYGDFYKFIYDDRIRTLLPQLKEDINPIGRELLEKELDGYDLNRVTIFQNIHEFEKFVIDKHPELKMQKHQFKDLINIHGLISEKTNQDLRDVRNAFSHNHYTKCIDISQKELPDIARTITEYFEKIVSDSKKGKKD